MTIASGQTTRPATAPSDLIPNVLDAKGLDDALEKLHAPMRETDPLSPTDAQRRFKLPEGYVVDLVAAEPEVRQPLNITFDERGRMWVVQYIQYPFPAGLKVVEYDRYIRAKFDRVPNAPPHHARGHDKITIHEDTNGDGTFDKVKTFVDGLSIATSVLPGRGGVWVMNPPYLLFYPDVDRDDVPDADPIVHLSGFGLEDTHAVANSLTWGPDGWLYGCQGSTCTAKIKVEIPKRNSEISNPKSEISDPKSTTDFLGQAIWRYHTEKHIFEIFAEGGGNTFGLEFDDAGRAFSGTNHGKLRGMHYVQGGYGIKGWGKHGPLTNPYAFGFFEHMPHTGNGDRLTHTFVVYGGTLFPDLRGKIIAPNSLQSRIHVTRLEADGSTYKTVDEPFLMTADDGWFRPVDLKVGPDGAIYIADFYEKRISHVDPRDNWHRETGRIWRIRPKEWKPPKWHGLDTGPTRCVIATGLAGSRWHVETAMRILHDRKDTAEIPELRESLKSDNPRYDGIAVHWLWALNACGGLDEASTLVALKHRVPGVRMWAVRLIGDEKAQPPPAIASRLTELARSETDPQVRSQLASTAKRLPGECSLPILREMLLRDADAADPHIPLLIWWAMESKAVSDRDGVVDLFANYGAWKGKITRETVASRLARRYAADPTPANQAALVALLAAAPGDAERKVLMSGVSEAFAGGTIGELTPELRSALAKSSDPAIALRLGSREAAAAAIEQVRRDGKTAADEAKRVQLIALLGEVASPDAPPVLLEIAEKSKSKTARAAAMAALARFDDAKIGERIVGMYDKLPTGPEARPAAVATLVSRPAWGKPLLGAIASGSIPRADITPQQIDQLRQSPDVAVASLAEKVFGKAVRPSSEQIAAEVARVRHIVTTGAGDAARGKAIYTARCAACHTLFGEGGAVGPDLTGYERRNVTDMIVNAIDPNAYVREEYASFRIRTKDDQVLIGLITERGPGSLTLVDAAQQKQVIPRDRIADERALPTSIMPEGLLMGLIDQELRDLFKYLSKTSN